MNKFGLGFLIALVLIGSVWFFYQSYQEREELKASSELIQKQIQQVGKLIVTEGYYSKVFTFKNSQNLFLNLSNNTCIPTCPLKYFGDTSDNTCKICCKNCLKLVRLL